ncbi:MAG: hypothetical protein EBS05_20560 [Proteobacteria bacterium]|nr:hypothetical protein [Pseudomonadota bacterium]
MNRARAVRKKRQRAGALQDATATSAVTDFATASWSAVVLHRFGRAARTPKSTLGNETVARPAANVRRSCATKLAKRERRERQQNLEISAHLSFLQPTIQVAEIVVLGRDSSRRDAGK